MKRVVQLQHPKENALVFYSFLELAEAFQTARERDIARTINAGNFYIEHATKIVEHLLHICSRHTNRSHAPLPSGHTLCLTAGADDLYCLLQIQGATSPGCRYLAHAMPEGYGRFNSRFF